jgi:hypothetical protein
MKHKSFLTLFTFLITLSAFAQLQEPGPHGAFIVEGDLAFESEEHYQDYLLRFATPHGPKLIINTLADRKTFDVWAPAMRQNLTYCVSDSFGERKKDVVEALKVATEDWMNVSGVKFKYLSQEDRNCNERNTRVVFDVRPVNFGIYLARAFFPNYARAKRNVLIDASSFEFSFVAVTGFLRHELGHVLGFRHEHISNDGQGLCPEDDLFAPITSYDRSSVMHYPQCGGDNLIENLILSELDKEGARKVYP